MMDKQHIRNGYGKLHNDWTDTTSDHLPEYMKGTSEAAICPREGEGN